MKLVSKCDYLLFSRWSTKWLYIGNFNKPIIYYTDAKIFVLCWIITGIICPKWIIKQGNETERLGILK